MAQRSDPLSNMPELQEIMKLAAHDVLHNMQPPLDRIWSARNRRFAGAGCGIGSNWAQQDEVQVRTRVDPRKAGLRLFVWGPQA